MTGDPVWSAWSTGAVARARRAGRVAINPIVYAEGSIGYERLEDLDHALPPEAFERLHLPYAAAFLAGKCFLAYRRAGGARTSPLPDFYIGAHASVSAMSLLTRDAARYLRT